jgi:hypothetical protein
MRSDKRSIRIYCVFVVLLFAACLFLSGCGGFTGGSGDIKTFDFRKGTEGISMTFLDNAPPDRLFVGNDFSIAVKLKNVGAYDIIGDSKLTIDVPDETAVLFKEGRTKPFQLTGRSLYSGEGEETVLFFPARALCFPGYTGSRDSILRNYSRKIKAQACYGYETNANADICVDTHLYTRQVNENVPCVMQSVSLSGGQGGPVEVTQVTPQILPMGDNQMKFQLNIVVQKASGDSVRIFHPDVSNCDDFNRENRAIVSVQMGGKPMACEQSEIKLQKGGTTVICSRLDLTTADGTFKSPINVNIRYGIFQSLMKDISIEPQPGVTVDCNSLGN